MIFNKIVRYPMQNLKPKMDGLSVDGGIIHGIPALQLPSYEPNVLSIMWQNYVAIQLRATPIIFNTSMLQFSMQQ